MSVDSMNIERLFSLAGAYTHGAIIPVDGGTSINHQHASPEGT